MLLLARCGLPLAVSETNDLCSLEMLIARVRCTAARGTYCALEPLLPQRTFANNTKRPTPAIKPHIKRRLKKLCLSPAYFTSPPKPVNPECYKSTAAAVAEFLERRCTVLVSAFSKSFCLPKPKVTLYVALLHSRRSFAHLCAILR